jgi:oxaloacetate decarboxylase alpha subunit
MRTVTGTTLGFVDTTLRDAHQSLWNGRMTTAMMLPIASTIEEVGFEALDFMAMVSMDWCVRFQGENPWQRMRLMHQAMPTTPLIVGGVLRNFGNVPDPVSKDAGLMTLVAVIYTDSPVHTDEYFVSKARAIADAGADRMFIKDVDGLLTPQRVHALVPKLLAATDGIPLELHGHCNTGLAPLCYLEAIKLGIRTVHTAVAPLANGPSQPSIDNIIANARLHGFDTAVNGEALRAMTEHFDDVARREALPVGAPVEYDAFQFEHQLPGGMMSNYEAELERRGLAGRRDEVLREIARIRKELGFPIMVTPLSQYVGAQAILNIVTGERYAVVTDELLHYVLGHFGELAAPVDAAVLEHLMRLPRARALLDWRPAERSLDQVRAGFPAGIDDEELLLRALASNEPAVDALLAGEPVAADVPAGPAAVQDLIRALSGCKNLEEVQVTCDDFRLTVRRCG